jgi:hypothetical protein
MRPDEFKGRMRALEVFHSLRLPPGAWVILRLDGRSFSRFTEGRFLANPGSGRRPSGGFEVSSVESVRQLP